MKKLSSLFAAAIVLMTLSCQHSIDLKPEGNEVSEGAKIETIDGRLHFVSQAHFRQVINQIAEDQNKLDEFEQQFTGYKSVRRAFKELTESDNETIATAGVTSTYANYVYIDGEGDDREIVRTINDPLLATLVSQDGWLYIGSDAYKFSHNYFYIVKNYTKDQLARIGVGGDNSANVVHGTIRHAIRSQAGARPSSEDHCLQEYFVGNNKRRMAGVIGFDTYSTAGGTFYINAYSVAKHQKRSFGTIWSTSDTPYISTSGTVVVRDYTGGGGRTVSFSEARSNTGWAEVGFPSNQGPTLPSGTTWEPVYSNIVNNAYATCTDGTGRQCTVVRN